MSTPEYAATIVDPDGTRVPLGKDGYLEQSCVVYVENGSESYRIALEEKFVDVHANWQADVDPEHELPPRGTLRSASYKDNPSFTILFGVVTYWPPFKTQVIQAIDTLDRRILDAPIAEVRVEFGEQWVYPPNG